MNILTYLRNLYNYYYNLTAQCPALGEQLKALNDRISVVENAINSQKDIDNKPVFKDQGIFVFNNINSRYVREKLIQIIALFQLMDFTVNEARNGNPKFADAEAIKGDKVNSLISSLTSKLEKNGELMGKFVENQNTDQFAEMLKNQTEFINWTHDLNKDLESRMILNGNAAVSEDIERVLDGMSPETWGNNETLIKLVQDSINYLKTNAKLAINEKGEAVPDIVRWLCNLVACRELMLETAEHPEKYSRMSEVDLKNLVFASSDALQNSAFMKAALQNKKALKNAVNLLDILKNTELLAKRFHDVTHDPVINSDEVKNRKAQDVSTILNQQEEKENYVNLIADDGYYNVITKSFKQTREKMEKLIPLFRTMAQDCMRLCKTENLSVDEENILPALSKNFARIAVLLEDYSKNILLDKNQSSRRNHDYSYAKAQDKQDYDDLQEVSLKMDFILSRCESLIAGTGKIYETETFQKMYATVISASRQIDAVTSGNLFVPGEESPFLNGKKIQRITCRDNDKNTLLARDMEALKLGLQNREGYYAKNVEFNWEKSEPTPPFSHDPCPADIGQTFVGDCYFVSSLLAIAAKNPQAIRNMMTYNQADNTVTVRFYTPDNEPLYVTVDNTLPIFDFISDGRNYTETISRSARWVVLMEKAYMASGLYNQYNLNDPIDYEIIYKIIDKEREAEKKKEKNKTKPEPKDKYGLKKDVASIEGGRQAIALQMLFGNELGKFSPDVALNPKIFYTKTKYVEEYLPKKYSADDIAFYDKMKSLFDSGHPLTASIMQLRRKYQGMYQLMFDLHTVALMSQHAYGIVGFAEEKEKGKNEGEEFTRRYIYVKNPHSAVRRDYEYDKSVSKFLPKRVDDNYLGVSKMDLRDFLNQFSDVQTADFNTAPIEITRKFVVDQYKLLYEDTIRSMDNILQKVDAKDDREFKKLIVLSAQALEALHRDNINPDELTGTLAKFFDAVNDYVQTRDKIVRKEGNEKLTINEAKSYFAASVLQRLRLRFLKNEIDGVEHAKVFETDDLVEEALSSDTFNKYSAERNASVAIIKDLRMRRDLELNIRGRKVINLKKSDDNRKVGKNIILAANETEVFNQKGSSEYKQVKHALADYIAYKEGSRQKLYKAARDYLLKKDLMKIPAARKPRISVAAKLMAQTALDTLQVLPTAAEISPMIQDMKIEILRNKDFRAALMKELPELVKANNVCGEGAAQLCAFIHQVDEKEIHDGKAPALTGIYFNNKKNKAKAAEMIEQLQTRVKTEQDELLKCASPADIRGKCNYPSKVQQKENNAVNTDEVNNSRGLA